jgi:hypothetical protein
MPSATSCKYSALIDKILGSAKVTTVLAGVRMPRMNSVTERWVNASIQWVPATPDGFTAHSRPATARLVPLVRRSARDLCPQRRYRRTVQVPLGHRIFAGQQLQSGVRVPQVVDGDHGRRTIAQSLGTLALA